MNSNSQTHTHTEQGKAMEMTVDQLIEQLQAQQRHGRGQYQVRIGHMGSNQNFKPLLVAGLPAEAGEVVVMFAQRWSS